MANAISYSLFGYNNEREDSFSFKTYLRSLAINIRMADLLFPSFKINLVVDEQTYNSPYKDFFEYHKIGGGINLTVLPNTDFCIMMLWRLYPAFNNGEYAYDRVICRDIDSLLTYRERQATEYWIKSGRVAHAITDSISHTIPLMGGMVSFMSKELRESMSVSTFDELLRLSNNTDYRVKGSDQDFLNSVIYPKVHKSITQHYILGMPQTFLGDCYNYIQDVDVSDIPPVLKESNLLVNHIGAAGFPVDNVLKFIHKYMNQEREDYYNGGEILFPSVFYWQNN